MSPLELVQLTSPAEIRQHGAAWDDLWTHSELSSSLFRAEMVAQWLEHFAPSAKLRALAVLRDGRMLAALPLVQRRMGPLGVGDLTINCWSPNGELLLAPDPDAAPALDVLAAGLDRLPWPLVQLQWVPYAEPRWRMFLQALSRHGSRYCIDPRYEIGQVDVRRPPADYEAAWSRNHRKNVRKDLRKLQESGPLHLELHRDVPAGAVDRLVSEAFSLEDRSWKGDAGDSVVRQPGLLDYFLRQARQLAQWNVLRVAFLEHAGRRIAFEYGWLGKRAYFSYKVGYDPEYAPFGPGHLLRRFLLEELCNDPAVDLVDFHGPLTEALACWATQRYPIGRLTIAPRRWTSSLLLTGWNALRRLRGRTGTKEPRMNTDEHG